MNDIKKRAVALGFFDGLHTAHMAVLSRALEQKKNGLVPSILIFDRHPAEVIYGVEVKRLMTPERRDEILTGLGFEIIRCRFADIKELTPEEFVSRIIVNELNAGYVCCGYNYRFGKNGAGGCETLVKLCESAGITVGVCERITVNGKSVCSTAIREAATDGDMETVRLMLGRPLEFCTSVFSGDKRGRLLGAPTANQFLPENFIIPKFGVYASVVELEGIAYPAVTNIGNRPTFDGASLRSETFIIGFSGDLYGRSIDVKLYAFIRNEMKFDSFEALKKQIALDAAEAKRIIGDAESAACGSRFPISSAFEKKL